MGYGNGRIRDYVVSWPFDWRVLTDYDHDATDDWCGLICIGQLGLGLVVTLGICIDAVLCLGLLPATYTLRLMESSIPATIEN